MPLTLSAAVRRIDTHPAAGVRLLERLAARLESEGVPCCQWKGQRSSHRWASGRGDLDLLVDSRASAAFRAIAGELGFKPALLPGERQLPGVEHYFGYDPGVAGLLHLHVHFRLVLGDYWRTTYRLPLERQILETAVAGTLFKVPSPEYQFLIFVLRLILREGTRLPSRRWFTGIQIQLDDLHDGCDHAALERILEQHLPSVDYACFRRCVRWLRRECGAIEHLAVPRQLQRRLRAHARRPGFAAVLAAAAEQMLPVGTGRRFLSGRMRLADGGTVVALIGGDGSGKSTCVRQLEQWLCSDLATLRAQLGNPPRSLLTFLVGGAVKLERAITRMRSAEPRHATTLELGRYLCAARDCFRLYQRVQRYSAAGGIAVCERYPVSEIPSHVGPCIPNLLPPRPSASGQLLGRLEGWYYRQMLRPDLLLVLGLDPELAVARKADEPADYVRTRGRAVLEIDWSASGAHVVDASRPIEEVLDDIKAKVWKAL